MGVDRRRHRRHVVGGGARECCALPGRDIDRRASGPPITNGQAGAGTLVRYGDEDNCNAVRLQFDTGRGTNQRLSQLGVAAGQLNAIFLTHMHSDHTEGLADVLLLRWNYNSAGPKLEIVCSTDAKSPLGHTMSCANYVARIGDAYLASGEIAQRHAEDKSRLIGGPADIANVITFAPSNDLQVVWSSGDIKVTAIRSTDIPGHASYRVDTPAGSVVIAGDAGNDKFAPPRSSSTSDQVERLAQGVDVIVHSTMHPVMGPTATVACQRRSTTVRLGPPISVQWRNGPARSI